MSLLEGLVLATLVNAGYGSAAQQYSSPMGARPIGPLEGLVLLFSLLVTVPTAQVGPIGPLKGLVPSTCLRSNLFVHDGPTNEKITNMLWV